MLVRWLLHLGSACGWMGTRQGGSAIWRRLLRWVCALLRSYLMVRVLAGLVGLTPGIRWHGGRRAGVMEFPAMCGDSSSYRVLSLNWLDCRDRFSRRAPEAHSGTVELTQTGRQCGKAGSSAHVVTRSIMPHGLQSLIASTVSNVGEQLGENGPSREVDPTQPESSSESDGLEGNGSISESSSSSESPSPSPLFLFLNFSASVTLASSPFLTNT